LNTVLRKRLGGRRVEPWVLILSGILGLGLGLRLWGIRYGLPFGYQIDEERLYVRGAARMLGDGTLDPQYFDNPPLYTYLVAAALGVSHGAGSARELADVAQRGDLFLIARCLAAVLGTLSIWLTFVATRRFLDTTVGLAAAALMAVAFLPVFYSHVALSNVPAMAAACVCLIGVAGVLRRGGARDYVLAGLGLGVAAATKYIDGVVLVPLVVAAFLAPREGDALTLRRGLLTALGLAALAFFACNPYALIDWHHFATSVLAQRDVVGEDKFGQDPGGGVPYYLWTFTWGLGWIPAVGVLAGSVLLLVENRRVGLVLAPVVPLFILYMGLQTRYFGRWMLPVFPIVCMLSAYAGVRAARRLSAARPHLRRALVTAAAVALGAQSILYVVHNDRVLSRPHTLNVARTWMLEHIPAGAGLITEPFHAGQWRTPWSRTTQRLSGRSPDDLDYAEQLDAGLVRAYERRGYCWVMASSHYWGLDDPKLGRLAGYYRALAREGTVEFSASPWGAIDSPHGPGQDAVDFNYDYAYDFYPFAYARPGPAVLIYRLQGGRCGPSHRSPRP